MTTTEPINKALISQPPLNATFMGVIMGVAHQFETGLTTTEYFAECGFAYAVNIHPEICPSGPYCWDHEPVLESLRQLGIDGKELEWATEARTPEGREKIEAQVKAGFTESVVSMIGLEHQLIINCDDEKMEFALPWGNEPGSCMPSLSFEDWKNQLEPPPFGFYRFDPCALAPKDVRVRQALSSAISMYESPSKFEIEDDKFGPGAYSLWLDALEHERGDLHGHWWNSQVWCECRYYASEYFHKWPLGSTKQTEELAKLFKKSSDLLREASSQALDNQSKMNLIRDVQASEALVLPLLLEVNSQFA